MSPIAAIESEFGPVLARLGYKVAGRFHADTERLEENYDLSDTVLGAGANGDVRLAQSRLDGSKSFAVKTISFNSIAGMDEWTMLENQLEVALLVDHPNVVGVTDVYETDEALHLVMPCMEGGALGEELSPVSLDGEKDLARQMVLALGYLHGQGIVHRDVKPSNFVLKQKQGKCLKIIDFDLCAFWQPGDSKLHSCCGTPGFMSPELQSGDGYTSQTDMWSLGATLFQLLVGKMPFSLQEAPNQEVVDELLNSQVTAGLNHDARDFIARLLRVDAAERPSAQEALRHPFVALHDQCQKAAQATRCAGRPNGRGRRQARRPQRGGTPCGGGTIVNTQTELAKLLTASEVHPLLPPVPLQQKIAAVRWADLEDDS